MSLRPVNSRPVLEVSLDLSAFADPKADSDWPALIRRQIEVSPMGAEVTFRWRGGASLNPAVLAFVFATQAPFTTGRVVKNVVEADGAPLDENTCDLLRRAKAMVVVRLGAGLPDAEDATEGIRRLRAHRVALRSVVKIGRREARRAPDIYARLVALGLADISFVPVVELKRRGPDLPVAAERAAEVVTAETVPAGAFGEALIEVYGRWFERDREQVKWEQIESARAAWAGREPTECAHTSRCRKAPAVDRGGEVFGCDKCTGPGYSLGNLRRAPLDMLASCAAAERFAEAKAELPSQCLACPVRFACRGDCPTHRFIRSGLGEPPISYLCPDYGRFFRHIDQGMRRMTSV